MSGETWYRLKSTRLVGWYGPARRTYAAAVALAAEYDQDAIGGPWTVVTEEV